MNGKLLWVDDEVELLKAHILFLEKKGYELDTASNATDAIDACRRETYDLILLDEMMPGLTGIEAVPIIKEIQPSTPIVMVTKSEEEDIMEQAIGSKIADYLIKPVNPNQILLTLKKNIHRQEIVAEATQSGYRQDFANLSTLIESCRTWDDWTEAYRRIVKWELDLSEADSAMREMLLQQKEEANREFAKFIRRSYMDWMASDGDRPLMSTDIFKRRVFPLLDGGSQVFLIVIDNFRFDQWKAISQDIAPLFNIEEELYSSILPTATQYARNAIFSGLMPDKIESMFPDLWVDEDSEEGKNLNEEPLIRTQMERHRRHDSFSYHKINDSAAAERLLERLPQLRANNLNVVVMNFIDMLSHARTESRMVRELANNESAYRSITLSWFRHSATSELLRRIAESGATIVLTTDHGSIRVARPIKIVGDRNTNTNLRYKLGRNLGYNAKEVFEIREPHKAHLPSPNISTSYVFATGSNFFAYPNNYNYYASYYRDTFQHGGVSMEEMICPLITLSPRKR